MPRVQDPGIYYMKAEAWGFPNTGKSTFLASVCNVPPINDTKRDIILFTNQALYTETLENFPGKKDQFVVYLHRSLEEFEHDWDEFCDEYNYGVTADSRGRMALHNTEEIEKRVHAILIDEVEYIYREGYCERHRKNMDVDNLRQKDYGVPRRQLSLQLNKMAALPCHFLFASNAGWEFKEHRATKRDQTLGALTFKKTGGDTYRLPDKTLYLPSLSLHLFKHEKNLYKKWTNPEDNKEYMVQKMDELNRPMIERTFLGEGIKQKANREVDFLVQNPTVSKVIFHLRRIRKEVKIN